MEFGREFMGSGRLLTIIFDKINRDMHVTLHNRIWILLETKNVANRHCNPGHTGAVSSEAPYSPISAKHAICD